MRLHPFSKTNRSAVFTLSFGFTLTGFGVALPGAALPALLVHWHLQDRGGGLLFLLAWLGSTGGAVLSRGNQWHSVLRGTLLTCAASILLAVAVEPWIYAAVLVYGIGLGISMTSISVLRAQQTATPLTLGSDRQTRGLPHAIHTPAHELNRLNMLWALGALSCPALAARSILSNSPGPLLVTVGLVFGFVAAAVYLTGREPARRRLGEAGRRVGSPAIPVPSPLQSTVAVLPAVPMALAMFAALAVGVESALGGWLTTYTQRSQHGISVEVSVATAFWAGLLLSRALHTSRLTGVATPDRWLQVHAALTLASVSLIAITHNRVNLLIFALIAGLGLGPLYPMTLGFVLPRYRGRLIFVLAGLGSAFFPWATGLLSTELRSLREALIVCCLASVGIVVLSFALRSSIFVQPDPQQKKCSDSLQ